MDKILVVEDDKTVYSGIKKLLELQHYSVVIAQNGIEALEKIVQPCNNGYNDATVGRH